MRIALGWTRTWVASCRPMSGGPRVPHRVDRSVLCPGTVRSLRVVVLASEQAEPGDLAVGDVVLVAFGSNQPPGHEQVGTRPAIVVSVPPPPLRYAVLIVVPITSQAGMWAESNPRVYPRLPAEAGVREGAVALCDQVRACDARRILRFLGSLQTETFAQVERGVRTCLGVRPTAQGSQANGTSTQPAC